MKRPLSEVCRQDLRRLRVQSLLAQIMHIVEEHICDHEPRNHRREVTNKLYDLFATEGVEVLTDYTRQEAGLPPRGPDGWTLEEIIALEKRRLEILNRPISFVVPFGAQEKAEG